MEIALTPIEFARRAARLYADKEAVVEGNKRFTYSEFFDRCNRWSSTPVSYTHLTLPTTPYV